jgi:FecR protein
MKHNEDHQGTRRIPGDEHPSEDENQYLWDGTGEVDPAVSSLEEDLTAVRLARRTFGEERLDADVYQGRRVAWKLTRGRGLLAAAAVIAVALSAWLVLRPTDSGWVVEQFAGSPSLGSAVMGADARIVAGDWITTDSDSRATFRRRGIGTVTLEAEGRIRVVRASRKEHRLELARGRISAVIVSPPRLFIVETPAATAIDMGCAYTLDVDAAGAGLLEVTAGRVDLEGANGEVRVTSGAACEILPGAGPGTPYFLDADAAFVAAVRRFDSADGEARSAAVSEILDTARDRDSITVWHVAMRQGGRDREAAVDRLLALAPGLISEGRAVKTSDAQLKKWWGGLGLAW